MPTIFDILTLRSKMYFMLSRGEHVKRFITSRPDFIILRYYIETIAILPSQHVKSSKGMKNHNQQAQFGKPCRP